MITFILKRILEAIPVLLIILTLTFFMIRSAPGDPFSSEKDMPPEVHQELMSQYGLDDPLHIQYFRYIGLVKSPDGTHYSGLLQGDFGPSYSHPSWEVSELIHDRIPVSIELGLYALLIAIILGVSIGMLAAIRAHTFSDYTLMAFAMIGICLPTFVLGPILTWVFGIQLEWLPVWGWILPQDRILPACTLGVFYAAYIARLMRGSLIEARYQDYIRTAQAKGLSAMRTYCVHLLRNALTPVVSFMGPAAAGLISGSFVIETIFQIPGLGKLFVDSAMNRDHTLLLGLTLFFATLVIVFNLIVDVILVWINPKLSFDRKAS